MPATSDAASKSRVCAGRRAVISLPLEWDNVQL
jgi:hypothetical protein